MEGGGGGGGGGGGNYECFHLQASQERSNTVCVTEVLYLNKVLYIWNIWTEVLYLNKVHYLLRNLTSQGAAMCGLLFNKEEDKQVSSYTSATQAGLVHDVTDTYRQPDTKRQRLQPCFRDFQTPVLSKLDHKSTEKLLWIWWLFVVVSCF